MSKDGFSFRGALLQVCTSGMGRETWKKFCFLFDVPESVTERGRSDVLGYLVDSGLVSSEKPGCFAEQLRNHLERHDLAQKFLELYNGRGSFREEPPETTRVETREKTDRRSHSPERRHGKHLPEFTLPEITLPEISLKEAEKGATSQRPARFIESLEVDRASGLFRPRQGSSLSTCSNRSSGYISQRSSSVASRESLQSWSYEDSGEHQNIGEHLKTVPEFTRGESPTSSFASAEDDEFRSCTSGSVEDIDSSSDVLCSKMGRLGPLSPPTTKDRPLVGSLSHLTTKDRPLVGPLSPPAPRDSPPEVVDSPTYSQAMQTVTIQMNLDHRELLHDIEKRQTKKLYRSTSPFSPCPPHGIQFVLRFYPTNHEGSGSALYVDVISHSTRAGASIPPLDISVSVWDSKQVPFNKDSCTHTRDSLAYSQKGLRDGFLSQGMYTVPFPKVMDHATLRAVSGGAIIIQAIIEYSTLFSRDHH